MAASKTLIVNALESRYDYYSARNVMKDALRIAGLEEQDNYSDAEVGAFIEALAEVGDRVEGVLSRLQAHSGGAKEKPAAKPAVKAAPAAEAPKQKAAKAKPAAKKEAADKPKAAKKEATDKPKAAKKKAAKKKPAKKK